MQLPLAFLNPPKTPIPTPWDQLDEAARVVALEILSRLIARMLAARQVKEAIDD
jgi:hypothetical protein